MPNRETAPKIKYVCPECGEESLYADASVYWDEDTQTWEIGGDSDVSSGTTLYCGECGAQTCAGKARRDKPEAPEIRNFTFNIACDVRAYGTVEIEATDIEAAKALLTADYVAEHFSPHGNGSDDLDHQHPRAIWSECATDELSGEEWTLELDVAPGKWDR